MKINYRMAFVAATLASCPAFAAAPAQPAAVETAEVCAVPKVIVPRPQDPRELPAWVASRVHDLQPTPQERKIDRIGWSRTILDAEKLARAHNRPVFLFTHDGRINTGRC